MICLNNNYNGIKEEIDYIKNHILDCNTPNDAAVYGQLFRALTLLYYECTGDIYIDKKVSRNCYASYSGENQQHVLYNRFHNNFLMNKSFHLEMFKNSIYNMFDVLDDYMRSEAYANLYQQYIPPFNENKNEEIDILKQYFKEKDQDLIDIFTDLEKQGRIYQYPNDLFGEARPVASLNSVQNKVDLFIPKVLCNTSFLSGLVHELAHVKDFYDVRSSVSKKAQQMYAMKSIYIETLSTEYEFDFLEFLILNHVHEEEAKRVLVTAYYNYLDYLNDALLYTSLPNDYHYTAVAGRLSEKQVIKILNPIYPDIDEIEENSLLDFRESILYSYGILLSPVLEDQKVREQFLTIRHNLFDQNDLISIGITPKVVAQNMNQKMKTYFRS